jgi:hypothetical protein
MNTFTVVNRTYQKRQHICVTSFDLFNALTEQSQRCKHKKGTHSGTHTEARQQSCMHAHNNLKHSLSSMCLLVCCFAFAVKF